ncbi:putative polyhydroxyalkanoate granule associated protein [Pseudoxanthomonas spadix BD-a59]|uniref:Poly(3-hydroxyalkanoate) polymerase subunit PhaE n=2 Tax=Pseudoxanthomonas spadix TaxID=415229 RepID=G7UP58_PSEUP|nr:putative polyhydroxyalkanoate granule associated protein [Pseudoxanthomonas spadix BD-a59]
MIWTGVGSAVMAGAQSGWDERAEALGRTAWEAWGQALRKAAAVPLEIAAPAWQQVPGGWPGWTPPQGVNDGDVMERSEGIARHWFGRMQHVAAQFADRDNTPEEIVAAWRKALGATEARPYPDLFSSLFGPGAFGLEGLGEQWMPWLEALRGPLDEWAAMPAFGPAREHQQRWKALVQTQQALREAAESCQRLLEEASRQAYVLFEQKLGKRAESAAPLDSARALFDEWIDAAEDAYEKMALSPEFSQVYAALANAQMRMRAGMQREVEQVGDMLGLPSRSEVDAAHRKIQELERALRGLMRASGLAAAPTEPATPGASAGSSAARPKSRRSADAGPLSAARKSSSKAAARKTQAKAAPDPAPKRPARKASAGKAAKSTAKAVAAASRRGTGKAPATTRTRAKSRP